MQPIAQWQQPFSLIPELCGPTPFRLHNMRTVYVLAPDKQRSVAEETLEVWCSMAESLGWDGLKVRGNDGGGLAGQ